MSNKVAFKTEKVFELEMVKSAFKDAGIPFFYREVNLSGLPLGLPLTPLSGPGISHSLLVPEAAFEDAREIIDTLPVEQTDDPTSSSEEGKEPLTK